MAFRYRPSTLSSYICYPGDVKKTFSGNLTHHKTDHVMFWSEEPGISQVAAKSGKMAESSFGVVS